MDKFYEFSRKAKPLFERNWHDEPYLMENLLVAQAQSREAGEQNIHFELCVNYFGQNVAKQYVQKAFPEEIKLLEDIYKEEPVSKANRWGAITCGSPAIIFSYSLGGEDLKQDDILDRNLLHARSRMMAEQLNEALLGNSVNICATFNSDLTDENNPADEIHAIVRADRAPEVRAAFEKEFEALLERLALTLNAEWVKKQYDTLITAINENKDSDQYVKRAIKAGIPVEDIVIEACGFLGQHIGGRQSMFDEARLSHDMDRAQRLAAKCDLSKNQELLYKCMANGSLRARSHGAMEVTLYTKPLEERRTSSSDSFKLTKNELCSILHEMGYEKDVTVSSFLDSYSYEAAREIKVLYEERQKKPLDKLLNDAEQKRTGSEHKGTVQEQEHDL